MTIFIAILTGFGALWLAAGYALGLYSGTREKEALNQRLQLQSRTLRQLSGKFPALFVELELSLLALAEVDAVHRRDLRLLLNKIAETGSFTAVFLSDDEGRPLASTRTSKNLERLAAASTRLTIAAAQISGEDGPDPLSIMLHDASGSTLLCRMFHARGQKLSLTAVSDDLPLTSAALDVAVKRIETALAAPWDDGGKV